MKIKYNNQKWKELSIVSMDGGVNVVGNLLQALYVYIVNEWLKTFIWLDLY